MQRESETVQIPSVSNAAQAGENARKNSLLNLRSGNHDKTYARD
jgi:hypothetical protein